MSLGANLVWEVDRATGNDANGGAFDAVSGVPGVDYTQGAGQATFNYTDLAIQVTTTNLTSVNRPFTANDVGNTIRVSAGAGFSAGNYQIMSVAAGVATCDRSVGAGLSTGGTAVLGGALATPGMLGNSTSGMQPGNIAWVKYNATAYSFTSTTSNVTGGKLASGNTGTGLLPMVLMGYNTTRGDAPTLANRPVLKCGVNFASNNLVAFTGVAFVEHLIFDGNRANFTNCGLFATNARGTIRNCKFMSSGLSTGPWGGMTTGSFIDCEITDCSAPWNGGGATGVNCIACYFHDNVGAAADISGCNVTFWDCIFDTNGGAGIICGTVSSTLIAAINCVFYGNTGAGVDFTAAPGEAFFANCIFESNTTYGIKTAATYPTIRTDSCAFYNNTTAKYPAGQVVARNITNEIIPTSTVFTNGPSGDFSLNTSPTGGALLRGTGFPQTFPGGLTTSKPPVGSVSPVASSAPARGGGIPGY